MTTRRARMAIKFACMVSGLFAGPCGPIAFAESEGNSGNLWEHLAANDWPVLYKSKEGPIDKWSLQGRFDAQYGHLFSDQGDAEHSEIRRLRFGTRIKFLDDWSFKLVADLVEDNEASYGGLEAAHLTYQPSKSLKIRLGKQMPHFSQEWSTPSWDLRVIERSLLVQQIRPRKSTGLTVSGDWEDLDYEFGVFSGEFDREFGGNDGGLFYLASIGYDFSDLLDGWKDFDLRLYYMHNDGDRGNTGLKPYGDSFSAAIKLRRDRFRLSAEAIYADGIQGRPDAWGFLVTPSWELIDDKLDLVLRYHYAKSGRRDGLRLRTRYERMAPNLTDRGRGEEYQSLYLGIKYHLIEDRLVFMAGGEWAEMRDHFGDGGAFDGFTFLSALRFDF